MTFRCPLRNEWDQQKAQFALMAKSAGRDGVMARAMLDVMPAMIAIVERERDRNTSPQDFFDAVAAVCGAMIEEAIEKQTLVHAVSPAASLQRMLELIHRVVQPRVTRRSPRLIVPEY